MCTTVEYERIHTTPPRPSSPEEPPCTMNNGYTYFTTTFFSSSSSSSTITLQLNLSSPFTVQASSTVWLWPLSLSRPTPIPFIPFCLLSLLTLQTNSILFFFRPFVLTWSFSPCLSPSLIFSSHTACHSLHCHAPHLTFCSYGYSLRHFGKSLVFDI